MPDRSTVVPHAPFYIRFPVYLFTVFRQNAPPKALGLYMEQDVATSIPVVVVTFLERSFSWRIHLRIFSSSPFQVGLFLITETISHITNFPTCSDWYKPIFFGPAPFALVVPVAAFTRLAFSYTFSSSSSKRPKAGNTVAKQNKAF